MHNFMVNHILRQSEIFKDFEEKNERLRYKDFWKNGETTDERVDAIYKRKLRATYYTWNTKK